MRKIEDLDEFKVAYLKGQQEIYNKMHNAVSSNETKCISLFGYNYEEILKMINAYNREMKMTKLEAYQKLSESQEGKGFTGEHIPITLFCDYLEALGLIEFTERTDIPTITTVIRKELADNGVQNAAHRTDDVINALVRAGYIIKQKD